MEKSAEVKIISDAEFICHMGSVTGQVLCTNDPELQVIIVPEGFRLEKMHTEPACPKRKEQTVKMTRVDSFCEYVNEHKGKNTRVFVSDGNEGTKYTAIIDYHNAGPSGLAEWKKHICILCLEHSKEFFDFKENNGKSFVQSAFAEFLEDHAHCIVSPSAAEMMEIALTLEGVKGANFRSGVRLNNGTVQIKYEETIDARAGEKGQLEIPDRFKLSLVPFKGGAAAEMNAMLRYRINNGNLTFSFKIVDLARTLDSAIEATTAKIKEAVSLPVFFGTATA